MSPVEITGAQYPISKVFSTEFVFTIPRYQRPYAWTTEQAGELLDDLLVSLNSGSGPVQGLNPYFLGSIVLIKGDGPAAQVVDGQQRLTTLTILLAVLRKLVGGDVANDLTDHIYEKAKRLLGIPDRYRLTLRDRDSKFFQEYVQMEGGLERLEALGAARLSDSQSHLRENAMLLLSRLQGMSQSALERLAQFLVTRCYLVVVSTPDFDSAYRIFSVLNDRGLDLSHSDILKAEIVGAIPSDREEAYTRKWEEAEENLGREAFKDLFAHIRMIYRKSKLVGTVLKEFREYVRPADAPKDFIDHTLLPMADAFDDILQASYESTARTDDVNRQLRWLRQVDNADWMPPAVLHLSRHRNNPDELVAFLRDLERLAMGLMIRRADINERIERYGRLLAAIEAGADLYDNASPLQLSDAERADIIQRLNSDIYNVVKIRLPVLLRLDAALSTGEASYDHSVITVEHVLPQNPPEASMWVKWFPDPDLRGATVHRLGNLALLSRRKNAQAQNFEFDRKKQEYFARGGVSSFALTTQVLQETDWTPETVEKRQERLLAVLKQVWRL